MGNKQLSPQKHFDKRFNEEMELYNKVKSVFVFIREIKDVLSKDVDVKHIRQMVKDLKRNKFISIKIKDIEKENNKERMKAKLGLILEELNFLKKELIGKESDFYSVFKIRDPHFMFFGAEYPYACQENFQSCINYAGIKGAVIELYPQLYTKLDLDLMRPNSEKIIGLAVGTYREHAQVHGFLGHDLATRKKINVKLIRKIYTNNLAEVQPLVSKSGINIPILSFNNHREEFRKVMGEIEMVLKKNGLIS